MSEAPLAQKNNVPTVGGATTLLKQTLLGFLPRPPASLAFSLLDLLQMNTMPFVLGKQRFSQGQYGLSSGRTKKDTLKRSPLLGSGSSSGSSGSTSVSLESGKVTPARLSPPLRYRTGMKEATLDDDIESVLDLNISEGKKPVNQSVLSTRTLRDGFHPLKPEMVTSASQGAFNSDNSLAWLQICKTTPTRDSSLDWLQICKTTPTRDSSLDWLQICKIPMNDNPPESCPSSTHLSHDNRWLEPSSEVKNNTDLRTMSPEPSQSMYTPELAAKINQRFGVEKDDLDSLLSYHEDQITGESLPLILQQACIQREKCPTVQSDPNSPEPPPTAGVSVVDRLGSFVGADTFQDGIPAAGLEPSEGVCIRPSVDAGETEGDIGGEDNRVGRRTVVMFGTSMSSSLSRGPSEGTIQVRISRPGPSCDLQGFVVPPACDPAKPHQIQPIQDSPTHLTFPSLPEQDTGVTSEASKNTGLPETPKAQPSPLHGPGPSGIEHKSSSDERCTEIHSKGLQVTQRIKSQTQQHLKVPKSIIVLPPQVKPAEPTKTDLARSTISASPALAQLTSSVNSTDAQQQSPSTKVPPPFVVEDYSGVMPRRFPHTCSLCHLRTFHMKDWLSHQKTRQHHDCCKELLKRYPSWDRTELPVTSFPGRNAKLAATTSDKTCRYPRCKSRSRSRSPCRYRRLRCRRSRSRSRSLDRRRSARHRSRPRSRNRGSSYRRGEKPSSPRRLQENPSNRDSLKPRGLSSVEKQPEITAVDSESDVEVVGEILPPVLAIKSDEVWSASSTAAPSSSSSSVVRRSKSLEVKSSHQKRNAGSSGTLQGQRRAELRSYSPDPVTSLTVGEQMEIHLQRRNLMCSNLTNFHSTKLQNKLLLVGNLPVFHHNHYTEANVADLLRPFGFHYSDQSIFVLPTLRMAFVVMPSITELRKFYIKNQKEFTFKGSKLILEIIHCKIFTSPFQFYKSLMKLMNFDVTNDGSSVVFIQNISSQEAKDLRENSKKMGSVRNYMPLLNKVFIEFTSIYDADGLGVWYSRLNRGLDHRVFRLKAPQGSATSSRQRRGENSSAHINDYVARALMLTTNTQDVPHGSSPPFWVTMTTAPYMFPTAAPCFIIPDFLTVNQISDITEAEPRASVFSTIMLTGLPEENYTHEGIADLVSGCFPEKNRPFQSFNLIVLTMQRRAFLYFNTWEACRCFVLNYLTNPVSLRGCVPRPAIHFVLQDMHPGLDEVTVYSNLIKWCNAHPPVLDTLEDRLLCVDVSDTSMSLVMKVTEMVASVAPFLNYLALADKIYIEMVKSNDAEKVEEVFSTARLSRPETWRNVLHVESPMTRKRLQGLHTAVGAEPPEAPGPLAVSSGSTDPVSEQSYETLKETCNPVTHPSALDLPEQKPEKLVKQMEVDDTTRNQTQEAGPETSECQLKTSSSKIDEQSNKPERKYETRANYSKTEEDMTPGGSGRRQSTRTLNKQEKALNPDVDKAGTNKPVTPMSTRGRKAKTEAENEKTQEDGTILTMTRTKPTREQSPRREETTSAEEEGTAEVQPSQKPKRGRPKKQSAAVKENVSLPSKAALVSEDQMLDYPEDKETAAAEDEVVVKDGGDATASENQTCSLHHEVRKEPDKREDETLRSSKRHHEEETGSGGEVEQLLGPVAKQPCSDSDVSKPQPSDPDESLGRRFVERKLGFFCSLCSVFYVDKSKMEDQHCCSRGHYNNLKKYYQKLQQLPPRT
nr:uncharacterized protein LOC107376898 isoform X2 [Nothobranchius furzeri]